MDSCPGSSGQCRGHRALRCQRSVQAARIGWQGWAHADLLRVSSVCPQMPFLPLPNTVAWTQSISSLDLYLTLSLRLRKISGNLILSLLFGGHTWRCSGLSTAELRGPRGGGLPRTKPKSAVCMASALPPSYPPCAQMRGHASRTCWLPPPSCLKPQGRSVAASQVPVTSERHRWAPCGSLQQQT